MKARQRDGDERGLVLQGIWAVWRDRCYLCREERWAHTHPVASAISVPSWDEQTDVWRGCSNMLRLSELIQPFLKESFFSPLHLPPSPTPLSAHHTSFSKFFQSCSYSVSTMCVRSSNSEMILYRMNLCIVSFYMFLFVAVTSWTLAFSINASSVISDWIITVYSAGGVGVAATNVILQCSQVPKQIRVRHTHSDTKDIQYFQYNK